MDRKESGRYENQLTVTHTHTHTHLLRVAAIAGHTWGSGKVTRSRPRSADRSHRTPAPSTPIHCLPPQAFARRTVLWSHLVAPHTSTQKQKMGFSSGVVQVVIIAAAVVSCVSASKPPKSKVVKCAVCRSVVSELYDAILEVDPRKTIEVGSYRIEADGKQKVSAVKYAGSEVHMMEVMETVCKSMKDYAQARHKETGRLEAIKLVVGGSMNPRMGEYDMVQDPDLNKGLEFHCEAIVEEFEDEIGSFFKNSGDSKLFDLQEQFCNEVTSLCLDVKDEL